MPSVADDRAGKTIYADDVKIIKGKIRRTATASAQKASLQLINRDRTELYHRLDQMVSDDIVTPLEKRALQLEWNQVQSERSNITMKAMEYGITEQEVYRNYSDAFTSLSFIIGIVLDPLHTNEYTDISELGDIRSSFVQYHQMLALLGEQLFRYETGMLGGLDYRVKLAITVTATKNPLPLNGIPSTLSASIVRDGVEATGEYDPTCFTWERLSEDRTADQTWNDNHASHSKTLLVNVDDLVYGYASFICNFYYQYSETMYIAKSGFITLSKEIPGPKGEDAYSVEVISQDGTVFRMGQPFTTTFEVQVKQGGEDITGFFTDEDFRWRRTSSDPYSDALWNSTHFSTGGKTLTITQADTAGKSNFFCDLLTERSN